MPSATSRRCAPRCGPAGTGSARACGPPGFGVSCRRAATSSTADVAPLGVRDARAWCLALPARAGVVAIPTSAFYDDPDGGRTLVRFAFCKRPEVIDEAVARLTAAVAARSD